VLVEAHVEEPSAERFHVRILIRLAGLRVALRDSVLTYPGIMIPPTGSYAFVAALNARARPRSVQSNAK
jgi:hypothetical protein